MTTPLHTTGAAPATNAVPLHEVTFIVLDLETTGTSPATARITEIGAVKYRGGEPLGTLATLVAPDVAMPPLVTALTGITDSMLEGAPSIESVVPSLVEFVGGATIVGHNVGFDRSFLEAALARSERTGFGGGYLDTLSLARALLADEVPNHRLATLARYLRAHHVPCHRALADALATADVFHALLERVATFGVFDLDGLTRFTGRRQPEGSSHD